MINSAARTAAASNAIRWERVRSVAEALEASDDCDVAGSCAAVLNPWTIDATIDGSCNWRVASRRSLEHAIAHSLRGLDSRTSLFRRQPVADAAAAEETVPLEPSALYYEWRWRGQRERATPSTLSSEHGWKAWDEEAGQGMIDPSVLILSRACEPVCWPKAWHFCSRMVAMSDEERIATFGLVPVHWVAHARRWACGNRHRLVASLLLGCDLPVRVKSGSRRPSARGHS